MSIDAIIDKLKKVEGLNLTDEEVRMLRIKFISDVAN